MKKIYALFIMIFVMIVSTYNTTYSNKLEVIDNLANTKDNGKIYLTFDDGPSYNVTPKLLDLLKKYNIKATFFVTMQSDNLDYLIVRAFNEGHTVAAHTASHKFKKIYGSQSAFFDDYNLINNKIIKLTKTNPKILRFAGGSSNTVSRFNPKIMTKLTTEVLNRGIKYYDWNIASLDTSRISSTKIARNVIKGLRKDRVNMVLMHDFNGNTKILKALEEIINYAYENNYTFSNITNDTAMIHHKLRN